MQVGPVADISSLDGTAVGIATNELDGSFHAVEHSLTAYARHAPTLGRDVDVVVFGIRFTLRTKCVGTAEQLQFYRCSCGIAATDALQLVAGIVGSHVKSVGGTYAERANRANFVGRSNVFGCREDVVGATPTIAANRLIEVEEPLWRGEIGRAKVDVERNGTMLDRSRLGRGIAEGNVSAIGCVTEVVDHTYHFVVERNGFAGIKAESGCRTNAEISRLHGFEGYRCACRRRIAPRKRVEVERPIVDHGAVRRIRQDELAVTDAVYRVV